jgi:hypothetical protein
MTRLALAVSALALLWLWGRPGIAPTTSQEARRAIVGAETIQHTGIALKADPVPDWQAHVTASFDTVDCRWWGFQTGCQHWGVDISGQGEGTPVYAPFGGSFRGCTYNGESGPLVGWWIEYTDDRGGDILINHFRDLGAWCDQPPGARIEAARWWILRLTGEITHDRRTKGKHSLSHQVLR